MYSLNVIYVLWLRQIKRYYRARSRVIGSLAQPLLFLVALGYGFGPVFAQAGQGNYLSFLVPGVMSMSIIFTAMFSGIEVIWDRQFGFLRETLVAPVSRLSIMLGRTLGGATVATGQGVIVFFISLLIGFRPTSWGLFIPAVLIMFLVAMLFTAVGTAVASRLEDMQGFQLIMNFLIMPLFFLSGALFPLNDLPSVLATIVRIDPLSYGVDALRGLLSGSAFFGLGLDVGVLAGVTVLFLAIGGYLFSTIEI
ncbi:MAG TPA: ABC transporter permease [Candidatus Paceibacterota bacterium]